ncbi:MAG: YlmC/YmxH family sporulation protein [Clostridia bacterium]|nr:YlmC/YmxH family sporulation protein [Clostridia bacterium]
MGCCINDLRDKEVVNVCNGKCLGSVCDVEIDVCTGRLTAIFVPAGNKIISFGKTKNTRIPWCNINKIGDDTILVSLPEENK